MRDLWGRQIHWTLRRVTDATTEPLSVEQVRTWHRLDEATQDDGEIAALIRAVRQQVEHDTNRALLTQTWELGLDRLPERGVIYLPVAPVQSITSIKAYSVADAESTVASSVYRLDAASTPARIVLKDGQSWPSDRRPENGLVVTFVAGYGDDADDLSGAEPLVHAMRLLLGHWYEHREAVVVGTSAQALPMAYEALVTPMKVFV